MAPAAAKLAGDPTRALRMAGITGTAGKTSTSYLTAALLEPAQHRPGCGLVGTVATRVGGVERPAVRTTPEAIKLQQDFRAMLDAGDEACVMEVSSHALVLRRADAIHWDAAAFTNLGRDHLDFHSDMEDYFAAKRRLFTAASAEGATLIACGDDVWGRRLAAEFPGTVRTGLGEGNDLRATEIRPDLTRTHVKIDGRDHTVPLPGRFNVQNALVAIAIARAFGVPDDDIDAGQDFGVIVDYAHKPDAVAEALRAAREIAGPHRVTCVIGAGGDRDREKRPLMAAAAAESADRVVLTSDNPRNEDPEMSLDAMAGGAPHAERITDRREAIARAVDLARTGDVVLIAGKGHETYQEFEDGRTVPFDDRLVAREAIGARLGR
jgi:UDP-N-acetylmuramoyl-L-alanyl-D-glutamate--2,6-diaminopimelate ligase